jgi:hypothetical protein
MTVYLLLALAFISFRIVDLHAQAKIDRTTRDRPWEEHRSSPNPQNAVDYPWVPRVSAYEAYVKYKAGKAIILHGGGQKYELRHIVGAYNMDFKPRESALKKLPKKGIEIFTYCYWKSEAGGAGLADEMIKMGFRNVKHVHGGGRALEKYFEYWYAPRFVNPLTGKETRIPHWKENRKAGPRDRYNN